MPGSAVARCGVDKTAALVCGLSREVFVSDRLIRLESGTKNTSGLTELLPGEL